MPARTEALIAEPSDGLGGGDQRISVDEKPGRIPGQVKIATTVVLHVAKGADAENRAGHVQLFCSLDKGRRTETVGTLRCVRLKSCQPEAC
jgi:hypothetical protein